MKKIKIQEGQWEDFREWIVSILAINGFTQSKADPFYRWERDSKLGTIFAMAPLDPGYEYVALLKFSNVERARFVGIPVDDEGRFQVRNDDKDKCILDFRDFILDIPTLEFMWSMEHVYLGELPTESCHMETEYQKNRRLAWFAFREANKNTGITLSVQSFCAGYDAAQREQRKVEPDKLRQVYDELASVEAKRNTRRLRLR